ncbi:hypothetical protein ABB02_01067 [Clostridiaceae bacterium JG1575]|nr:hypothetical protein ABB02_01067 [Clostridiaceae bacterium JG1575]
MLDSIFRMDYRIIRFINTRMRSQLLDYFNIAVTYLGSDVFALGVVLALVFLPQQYFRPFAVQAAVTLIISTIVVQLLKRIFKRKRPFEQMESLRSIRIGVDQFSFPSGHTAAAFALAASMSLLTRGAAISAGFLFLAFCVGFSRIYLAVHYPSDVIAGALIGSFFAILVHLLTPWMLMHLSQSVGRLLWRGIAVCFLPLPGPIAALLL